MLLERVEFTLVFVLTQVETCCQAFVLAPVYRAGWGALAFSAAAQITNRRREGGRAGCAVVIGSGGVSQSGCDRERDRDSQSQNPQGSLNFPVHSGVGETEVCHTALLVQYST